MLTPGTGAKKSDASLDLKKVDDTTEWERKLDNYEIELETKYDKKTESPTESNTRAANILGAPGATELLKGTKDSKTARQAFIQKLRQLLADDSIKVDLSKGDRRADNPEAYLIQMKTLLGKEGLKLYKAAIAEERNSAAFRNAVLLKATKHYNGPKWRERMVLWVGGPSASGKSFAADAIVERVGTEVMEKNEGDLSGNDVVSIDGGIEREVSQMRQLVLQLALRKGFAGISDLQENTKLSVKKKIRNAVLTNANLSLVIPCTFTSSLQGASIARYARMPNVRQIFSKIVGGETEEEKERFQRSVYRMGNSRAWSSQFGADDTTNRRITINNRRIGCESKKYEWWWFRAGKKFTAIARGRFLRAQAEQNRDAVYLSMTNDLMFVRQTSPGVWAECTEAYQGPVVRLSARAFKAWKAAGSPADLNAWLATNARLYSSAQIDMYINERRIVRATPHPNPADPNCLGNALIAEIKLGDNKRKNAVDSLFELVGNMEPAAKAAFYKSLKEKLVRPLDATTYDLVIQAYERLAAAKFKIDQAQQHLKFAKNNKQLKALLKAALEEEKSAKENLTQLRERISAIQTEVRNIDNNDERTWRSIIGDIPVDPLNQNNIFAQPLSIVDSNTPRHEDLRRGMSRNINHYRYIAPKGAGGAQEAGPLGGWYVGCYRTPDGRIHTQRVMIKREGKFCKNIIESICGRLKSRLVNVDQDYVASTYLVRNPQLAAVGANTYAVSIAFNDFTETHTLAGEDSRVKLAGTKKTLFGSKKAKRIFDLIDSLHNDEHYEGLEESFIATWVLADTDVHTGNIGASKRLKRILNIDHAGGMLEMDPKVHPNRYGLWQNMKRFMRLSPEPTYHAHEYSTSLRCSEQMANAIKRYTNRITISDIEEIVDDEIKNALENFRDDLEEIRRFGKRIGVPANRLPENNINKCITETKSFLKEITYARITNMRQYGNELELSLCFEYDRAQGKFIIKHPEKLVQFIRENPNYCLYHRHHFRGKSHGQSRSFLYHIFHNKFRWTHGYQLEQLLKEKTREVLGQQNGIEVDPLLAKDFELTNPADRAQNYMTRLRLIQIILDDAGLLATNPYKEKMKELIKFLQLYSGESARARRQHLVQVCDSAYATIRHVYEALSNDNQNALGAKIKIFEMLSTLHEKPALLTEYNTISRQVPVLHLDRENAINLRFKDAYARHSTGFTIDGSAFVRTVQHAVRHLESLATNIQYNEQRRMGANQLEQKRQPLQDLVTKLTKLPGAKGAPQDQLTQTLQRVEQVKEELKVKKMEDLRGKQEYLTKTKELHKKSDKSFLQQASEYFHQGTATSNNTSVNAVDFRTTVGNTVTNDKAVLLENPANATQSGAIMIHENDRTKMIDFENPNISFANLLAKLFLPFTTSGTSLDALRKHIQEHYIDVIQAKIPPQLVTKENLLHDLITPMVSQHSFNLTLPSSATIFGRKDVSFAEKIFTKFQQDIAWHPQLLSWANIWLKTFEAKGYNARDLFVENTKGNAEFARLLIILLCSKGADLNRVNQTGYQFNITPADIAQMKDIMENPANPKHAQAMGKTVDFQHSNRELERSTAVFFAAPPSELALLVNSINERIDQPLKAHTADELKLMKDRFDADRTQLQQLDRTGNYIQLYKDLPAKLTARINDIDNHLGHSKTI